MPNSGHVIVVNYDCSNIINIIMYSTIYHTPSPRAQIQIRTCTLKHLFVYRRTLAKTHTDIACRGDSLFRSLEYYLSVHFARLLIGMKIISASDFFFERAAGRFGRVPNEKSTIPIASPNEIS